MELPRGPQFFLEVPSFPRKKPKGIVPRLGLSHILLSTWEGWGGGAPIMLLTLPS